jgi:hypothetical protein
LLTATICALRVACAVVVDCFTSLQLAHAPDLRHPLACNPAVACLPLCRREAPGGQLHCIHCAAAGNARCEWVGGKQQVEANLHSCAVFACRAIACVIGLPCLPGHAATRIPSARLLTSGLHAPCFSCASTHLHCLQEGVMAICRLAATRARDPCLVALLPQEEVRDEDDQQVRARCARCTCCGCINAVQVVIV